MKLLFILPEFYPHSCGGIATYYQELIPTLLPHCKSIKVIVGSGYTQNDRHFNFQGINVSYLKPELFKKHVKKFSKFDLFPEFRNNLAASWAMWEQLQQEDFDLVECTDFGLGFIPWLIHHHHPVKIQLHGSTGQIEYFDPKPKEALSADFIRQTELLFFRLADQLQTHSSNNQMFWEEQLPQKAILKLPTVYQSYTLSTPFHRREPWGLVTGRIQYWKGPGMVCEAAKKLKKDMPAIRWMGRDMPYKDQQSMSAWLSKQYPRIWSSQITPTYARNLPEVRELQAKAKFGLIPSLWDMFNFSCLEFLAAGTLTICSDGAGAQEVIEHKQNGYTYPADDPQALAYILSEVTSLSESEYEKLAGHGQETVKTLLSARVLVPNYLKNYLEAIKNFKPAPENPYLKSIYEPSKNQYSLADLLDKHPLKQLSVYTLKRIRNKIRILR